jgi:DNA/RNA endonuclease G (NUC1)
MENSRNPEKDIQKCKVSVDSIENLTGYDFFEWLPDSLENELEK